MRRWVRARILVVVAICPVLGYATSAYLTGDSNAIADLIAAVAGLVTGAVTGALIVKQEQRQQQKERTAGSTSRFAAPVAPSWTAPAPNVVPRAADTSHAAARWSPNLAQLRDQVGQYGRNLLNDPHLRTLPKDP